MLQSDACQVALPQAVTKGPRLLPPYGCAILWVSGYSGIIQLVTTKKGEWKIVHPVFKHFNSKLVHITSSHIPSTRITYKV